MLQAPNMSSKSSSTRAPCSFYSLPRNVVLRIFTFLPLSSLLGTHRVSRRFRVLVTRSNELRPYLFLEPPPKSPPSADVPIFLHPVFERLNFFAYHSAKAVRIGEGLDSIFLQGSGVRKQFATSPALEELVIRVISGGEWPLDAKIVVENKKGVSVWDVLQGITRYFSQYEKSSFGEYFGVDTCKRRGYNPKVLMQNHDFLDPDLSFPTIIFPDRDCNKVFIADYAFNTFAAQPLFRRPAEWYTEGNEEVKVQEAPENDKTSNKTRNHGQTEIAKVVEGSGAGEVKTQKSKQAEKTDKNPHNMKDEEVNPIEAGSTGSQSMDIDYGSTHEDEWNQIDQTSLEDREDGFIPTGQATEFSRNLRFGVQTLNNRIGGLASSLGPSDPAPPINNSKPEVERAGLTSEEQAASSTVKSAFQSIKPAETLVQLTINGNTKIMGETLCIKPTKTPITESNEPRDWDDVFA